MKYQWLAFSGLATLTLILSSCSQVPQGGSAAELPANPVISTTPEQVPPVQPPQIPQPPQEVTSQAPSQPPVQPQPQAQSQDIRVDLANWLVQKGVRVYCAGWCPQCEKQMEWFGEQGAALLQQIRVDCDKTPDECAQKGVSRYPTWEVGGQLLESGRKPATYLAQYTQFPNSSAVPIEEGEEDFWNQLQNGGNR